MGEVWRAKDTRLDRIVAIKILPAEFAQNAQFKLRFEREATISQLNHPNICTKFSPKGERLVRRYVIDRELPAHLPTGATNVPVENDPLPARVVLEARELFHRATPVTRSSRPPLQGRRESAALPLPSM